MSEIKTKISTYNDVVDLFGEEKAADMLSEALDWSTIDPKNDKKNIMERKALLLDPYMTYENEDYCKHIVAGFLGDRDLACLAAQKCVDDHNWCVENLELTEDAIMNAKPIESGSEGLPKDCWDLNPQGRPFAVTEPILHRLQSSAKLCARAGTTTQFTRMTVNQWFDKAERSRRSPLGRSVDIGRAASALNSQHEHAEVPQHLSK